MHWPLNIEKFEPGAVCVCVGAAIRDRAGAVLVAVTCSMPRELAAGARMQFIAQAVLRGGQAICDRMPDLPARA